MPMFPGVEVPEKRSKNCVMLTATAKKKTQELHFTLYGSQLACQMLTFIKQKKTEQVWLIWKNCHASSPYKEPGTMA